MYLDLQNYDILQHKLLQIKIGSSYFLLDNINFRHLLIHAILFNISLLLYM